MPKESFSTRLCEDKLEYNSWPWFSKFILCNYAFIYDLYEALHREHMLHLNLKHYNL